MESFDVVIAGAWPAGLGVLVLERENAPRARNNRIRLWHGLSSNLYEKMAAPTS